MLPRVDIDLAALCANYGWLASSAPDAEAAAVVKCDAYGLGLAPVARALFLRADCRTFFVAYPLEGVALRAALADLPGADDTTIYVFHGVTEETREPVRQHRLRPVLNSLRQAEVWGASGPAALHIDTGMHRLGAPLVEARAIARLSGLTIDLVMSHFACAHDPASPKNAAQAKALAEACRLFPGVKCSLSATAGAIIMADKDAPYGLDLTRLGVGLYGASAMDAPDTRLKTVATLTAAVLQTHDLPAGESVGYGHIFTATSLRKLATLGLGYGDGFHRAASGKASVFLGGAVCPVVGRISMDLIVADVTNAPETVAVGDRAEVFGPNLAIEAAAENADTVAYELLTGLGPRINRRYLWGGEPAGAVLTGDVDR